MTVEIQGAIFLVLSCVIYASMHKQNKYLNSSHTNDYVIYLILMTTSTMSGELSALITMNLFISIS